MRTSNFLMGLPLFLTMACSQGASPTTELAPAEARAAISANTAGACLQGWRTNYPCGAYCTGQTQADRKNCQAFLDCYKNNNCGPTTCGGPDQVCGVNKVTPKMGSAPKEIADLVYECLACPGTTPSGSCVGKINTTPCADGNACTTKDTCQRGVCVAGPPVTCPTSDQCHKVSVCNAKTGICSNEKKPNGTSCDDGSLCTTSDQCNDGVCGSKNPVTCPSTGNPCVDSYCDAASGECLSAVAEGRTCDDGNPQTSGEMCLGGQCQVAETGDLASSECGAPLMRIRQLQQSPELVENVALAERKVQARIMAGKRAGGSDAYVEPVVIPVVFHILEHPEVYYVHDYQLTELIDKANVKLSQASSSTTSERAKQDASAVPIRLALAKRDATSCSSLGDTGAIHRVSVGDDIPNVLYSGQYNEGFVLFGSASCDEYWPWTQTKTHGAEGWDTSKYLNVWIAKYVSNSYEVGASFMPSFPTPSIGMSCDGISMNINNIPYGTDSHGGMSPLLSADVFVHELGHWLDLYHPQYPNEGGSSKIPGTCSGNTSDTCGTTGDFVCDTPAMLGRDSSNQCKVGLNTCVDNQLADDPVDQLENRMWFAQCGNSSMFTIDQVDRVQATLATVRTGILASQGDVPPVDGADGDLWSRDGVKDIGVEPDSDQDPVWASDDIWVRNQDDGVANQQHENPIYQLDAAGKVKPVYVYVRVRNRGCQQASSKPVTLQWAKASTNLGWPSPWDGTERLPSNNAPMGGMVEVKGTGVVASGSSTIVKFTWQPKDPSLYASFGGDNTHYCLLSTIGTVDTTSQDLDYLVRSRNDVVWRNLTVATEATDRAAFMTVRGNMFGDAQGLAFTEPELTNSPGSLFAWGAVKVELGSGLFSRWSAGGSLGTGIASVSGTEVTLSGPDAKLVNILLQPEDLFTLRVSAHPFAADTLPDRARVDVYRLDVTQFIQVSGQTQSVGGVRVALKTARPLPVAPSIP